MTTKINIGKPESEAIPEVVELFLKQEELHHQLDPEWYAAPSPKVAAKIKKELETMLRYGKTRILVAKIRKKIAGFITFTIQIDNYHNAIHKKYGDIYELYVAEAERGKGVGAALLDGAEKYFSARGITMITISSSSLNENAGSFYEKRGYRMITNVRSRRLS